MSFPVKGSRHMIVIRKLHKIIFSTLMLLSSWSFFLIKANFLLYIFIFHVLDGSISYPVWIKGTVVVNYYKANDISWQVILPSCACWFFPWLYCFYKCTNSYWNDEILVCTALIRTLSGYLCWRPVHKQLLSWSLAHTPVRHKVSLLPKSRTELVDILISSLGHLAMDNLIVNITRMGRDNLEVSYTLKSKHCVRWGKSIQELEKSNDEIMSNNFSPVPTQ